MGSVSAALPGAWEWASYHDTDGIEELLSLLETEYPDIASQFSIGTSVEGRALRGIKVQPPNFPTWKVPGIAAFALDSFPFLPAWLALSACP